jgi:signal transduction histidine kinase/CheY-like chemotaxis protein
MFRTADELAPDTGASNPLERALLVLTRIADQQVQGSVAAIMLFNTATGCLYSGVGDGLPAEYHQQLEGLKVTKSLGTCATAAATNKVVLTPDIANAPSWKGLSHVPLALGLKAAWSMPIRGSDGEVLGTFGTYFRECRTPTAQERQLVAGLCQSAAWAIERERSEEALRESQERLRNAVEAADVGTWRVDLRKGIDTRGAGDGPDGGDTGLHRILGLGISGSAHPFESRFAFIHPDDRARAEDAWRAAVDGADVYDVEVRIIRPGGEERWIRDRGRVVRGSLSEPLYVTGAAVDITERILAEQALRAADNQKNQFLAVLGHELRTPLAPLRTGLELLAASNTTERSRAAICTMMDRQVHHLVRLVDDLLDLSRITRGTISLQRTLLDLNHVVDIAADLARPLISERGHRLIIDKARAPLPIHGDLERLTQVTANLLTNAAKYMAPEGVIELRTSGDDKEATLSVLDQGYGVPAEWLPSLFNMFIQVPEHRELTGGGGLGIGLALSRQIIERHGGTIKASSEGLGLGSEFCFRLPLTEGAAHAPVGAGARKAKLSPPHRVLVVDDNVDAASIMRLLLKSQGLIVHAVHDGPAALEAIESFAPEIVLLDIGLPGMNGYEVAERIRATPTGQDLVLWAITGWGQEDDKRRARDAGFDEHFTKPVSSSQLLARIAAVPAAPP